MAQQDSASSASPATQLQPIEEVIGRRKPKKNINAQHEESLSNMERAALWTPKNIGTMGFFLIILLWTIAWMSWNYLAQRLHLPGVFDKPWQFGIWLFVSNLIQIHLMPLIMVGQNLQGRHSEMRAEKEFHTTQQTEREMEIALRYLEAGHRALKMLEQRLATLEKHLLPSPE